MLLGVMLNLVSCANAPPDVPAFLPFDENRAYYVYTISNREGWVDNGENLFTDEKYAPIPMKWNEVKKKAFIIPSFTWEEINTFISQICEKEKKKCRENGNPLIKIQNLNKVLKKRNDLEEGIK